MTTDSESVQRTGTGERPRVRGEERSSAGSLVAARVVADGAMLILALALAGLVRFEFGREAFAENPYLSWAPYVVAGCLWVTAVLIGAAARGLYDEDTLTTGGREVARMWQAILEGVAVVAIVSFLIRDEQLVSRSWFLLTVVLSAILVPAERVVFRNALASKRERGSFRRAAILVAGPQGSSLPDRLGEFDIARRMNAAEFLETVAREPERNGGGEVVMVDANDFDEETLWEVVVAAGGQGSSVFVMSRMRNVTTQRLTLRGIDGVGVMRVLPPRISGIRAVQKRALDLVVVVLASPFVVVAGLLIAVVQLVTAGRPIFYGQDRLGMDAKTFKMWKFRSMDIDAEAETGPVWTAKDDPRRTRFGRFLRRWSLDELPQLWSVFKGDMSMVGPRPERPELAQRFGSENKWYRHRLRIKPGVTGSAQAKGFRGPSSLEERLGLDNDYIENWSLGLDLQILAQTVGAVLRGANAE